MEPGAPGYVGRPLPLGGSLSRAALEGWLLANIDAGISVKGRHLEHRCWVLDAPPRFGDDERREHVWTLQVCRDVPGDPVIEEAAREVRGPSRPHVIAEGLDWLEEELRRRDLSLDDASAELMVSVDDFDDDAGPPVGGTRRRLAVALMVVPGAVLAAALLVALLAPLIR